MLFTYQTATTGLLRGGISIDGLKEYASDLFSITVEGANHTVHTIYAKQFAKNKCRIRDEYQGYPNTTLKKTVKEIKKLNSFEDSGPSSSSTKSPSIGTN